MLHNVRSFRSEKPVILKQFYLLSSTKLYAANKNIISTYIFINYNQFIT